LAEQQARTSSAEQHARESVKTYFTLVSDDPDLKAEGLEPLRRKLLGSAKDYFALFVQQQTDDPALRGELAEAFAKLAAITADTGDKRDAIEHLRNGIRIREELGDATAGGPEGRRRLATYSSALGALLLDTAGNDGAEAALGRAAALCEPLDDPRADGPHLRAAAQVFNHYGNLFTRTGRPDPALAAYERARGLWQRAVRAQPTNRANR